MNWKINYIYLKYRDYLLNDQNVYEIKRRYNLTSDDYAILNNKIKQYQMDTYGDILYYTGYEFHNKEELDYLRVKSNARKYARRRRKNVPKE